MSQTTTCISTSLSNDPSTVSNDPLTMSNNPLTMSNDSSTMSNDSSTTFDTIIIHPNDINLTSKNLQSEVPRLLKYCQIVKTTNDEIMYLLYDLLQLNEDTVGDSDIIYENGNTIYQLFHNSENLCPSEEKIKAKSTSEINKNSIATYLVNSEKKIKGPILLLSSKIESNYLCSTQNTTLYDVINLLTKTFKHIGNILRVDDSVTTFEYESPLDGISDLDKQNYNYLEATIYNFHIFGCYDSRVVPNPENFNKKASILLGTNVYGDIRICLSTETKFLDIENSLIDDLIYCSLHTKERTYENMEDMPEKYKGVTIVKNNYALLDRKLKTFKVQCYKNGCNEICNVDKNNIAMYDYKCNLCYKAFYHSKECMIQDNDTHKTTCLGL